MASVLCIVPKAWDSLPEFFVDLLVKANLQEHWNQHHTLFGASFTYDGITGTSQDYQGTAVWYKIIDDVAEHPTHGNYMLIEVTEIQ